MKKIILLLIPLVFMTSSLFGQKSRIEISNFKYYVKGDEKICETYVRLTAYFKDGSSDEFFFNYYGEGTFTSPAPELEYEFDGEIERLNVFAYTRELRGTTCRGDDTKIRQDIDIDLSNSSCLTGNHNKYVRNSGEFEAEHRLQFDYKVSAIVNLQQPENTLIGYDDFFNVATTPDSNSFSSTSLYNWQYQVVDTGFPLDNGWTDMSNSTFGQSSFDIKPSDFLLDRSVIGKTIYFRAKLCDGIYTENIINYEIGESAPQIIAIEPQRTTCFDSEDGSVKLTFDRALVTSNYEKVSINIYDLSSPIGTNPDGSPRYLKVNGDDDNITEFEPNNSYIINNLPKSTTEFIVEIAGVYGIDKDPYYTDGVDHTRVFMIEFNPPVAFTEKPSDSKVDVWCYGGNNGEVTLIAQGGTSINYQYQWRVKGGTFSNWIPFDSTTSDTQTIKNLAPNIYEYKISDGNICVAREQTVVDGVIKLGDDIIEEVEILAPQEELTLEYTGFKEPTAFGLSDGYIVAKVEGGTIKDDNTYNYEWKDENGTLLSSVATEFTTGAYYITLNDIGSGTYSLTITDKNYVAATDNDGCTIVNSSYFLDQPKPLSVTIEILEEISCNSSNEYTSEIDDDLNGIPNEAQDGALVAHAEGGIKLSDTDNNGLPYYYTWKKKDTNGDWVVLSEVDSIVRNLNVGDYALNIKDKNGIVLGEYVNNALIREIDSTFYLPEPPKLQTVMSANEITCSSGVNGEVKVAVSGGTPPYSYVWNTGDETDEVTNLSAGTYFVYVTDAKGCQIQDTVTIVQPDGIEIGLVSKIDPTCSYSTDGEIEVNITGGSPPYDLQWNTNATTPIIQNLIAGTYELIITDANDCKAFFEVVLESATPVVVDVGEDRTLCGGQLVSLDATIDDTGATYQWSSTNGFTSNSPFVDLIDAGTYTISVTSSKGCIATDEIVISIKDIPIDASFLLSSQAYAGAIIELANVSNPRGEITEWIVPIEGLIIEENEEHLIVKFTDPGEYEVSMLSYVDDCYKRITKNILVEESTNLPDVGDADNPFIKEFVVYPNPSNGIFNVKIVLAETSAISLRLVSMLNNEVVTRKEEIGANEYEVSYNVNLASGVYFMILETPKGTETRKVIIQ